MDDESTDNQDKKSQNGPEIKGLDLKITKEGEGAEVGAGTAERIGKNKFNFDFDFDLPIDAGKLKDDAQTQSSTATGISTHVRPATPERKRGEEVARGGGSEETEEEPKEPGGETEDAVQQGKTKQTDKQPKKQTTGQPETAAVPIPSAYPPRAGGDIETPVADEQTPEQTNQTEGQTSPISPPDKDENKKSASPETLEQAKPNQNQPEEEKPAEEKNQPEQTIPPQGQNGQPAAEQKKISQGDERNAANDIRRQKQKTLRERAGSALNTAKNIPGKTLNAGKNLAKNTANAIRNPKQALGGLGRGLKSKARDSLGRFGTERRELRKEIKKMEKELAEINGKLSGLKASPELRIIKIFFPSIYAKITGIANFGKNATSEIIIKQLQAKIIVLETAKKTLQAAEGTGATIDATKNVIQFGAATWEFVIGIIVLVLSPIIIPCLAIIYYILKFGTVTAAVHKITKQIDDILKPMKEKLAKEKKKLHLRRGIKEKYEELSQTGRLQMARQKQNEQQPGQQEPGQEQRPEPKQGPGAGGAANDNTEQQQQYRQAA